MELNLTNSPTRNKQVKICWVRHRNRIVPISDLRNDRMTNRVRAVLVVYIAIAIIFFLLDNTMAFYTELNSLLPVLSLKFDFRQYIWFFNKNTLWWSDTYHGYIQLNYLDYSMCSVGSLHLSSSNHNRSTADYGKEWRIRWKTSKRKTSKRERKYPCMEVFFFFFRRFSSIPSLPFIFYP